MKPHPLWKKGSISIGLIFAVSYVFALDVEQSAPLLRLETGSGLSNNYVSAQCMDDRGTIWIATEEGLNRIENSRITTYYKSASGLTDNALNDVLADNPRRRIWIATQRAGLCWLDCDTYEFGSYRHRPDDPHSLITDDVTHLELAPNSDLWLSTYHNGMERLDVASGRFTHFNSTTVEGMPAAPIHSFAVSGERVYVGHYRDGFTVLDAAARRAVNYRHDPSDGRSLPSDEVNSITIDRYDRIWVGTSAGLALFLPERGEFLHCTRSAGVFAIQLCSNDRLLLGTELGGAMEIDPQQLVQRQGPIDVTRPEGADRDAFRQLEGTQRLSIRSVLEDHFGNLWLGTYGSGVLLRRHHPMGLFRTWRSPYPITEDKILSLSFDTRGRLWVGTDGGGVNILDDAALARRCNQALGCGVVLSSHCDAEGRIWLGSYTRGGMVYDPHGDTFRKLDLDGGNSDVRCFCENGPQMWVGTSNGIFVLDRRTGRQQQHYTTRDRLVDNLVRTLLFDLRGRLWVGTFGGGLAVYDRGMRQLVRYSASDSLRSNEINYLHQDRHGDIWVATGEGLVRINSAGLYVEARFDRESGLTNDHIRAVSEDADGNIWFSTNVGIGCICSDGTICNFDRRDGLTSGNFSSNSVAQAADGLTCFGSTQGVVYFYPQQFFVKTDAPQVRISEMQILDYRIAGQPVVQTVTAVSDDRPVTLSYHQNNFRIWFGVTDFSLADKVEYAYKLDGDDWVVTDNDHLSFIRFSPGSYELSFRARIRGQEWSEQVETLQLTIRPPWYLAWYARVFYGLMILGFVVLVVRRYIRHLERERELRYEYESMSLYRQVNDERLRFFMNITHELRTPLTLILGPLEDLKQDKELPVQPHEKVSIAYRSAQQLLSLVNELLEFRKTETGNRKLEVRFDDLSQCVEETGALFRDSNLNPDTQFRMEIETGVSAYFDSKVITTILNNLLSNAMKYTPRGTVTLFLHTLTDNGVRYAEFGVSDTGYGMPEEDLKHIFERYYRIHNSPNSSHIMGTGIGLALVKSLVVLHQATIRVESRLHEGSTFRVRLRLDNTYSEVAAVDPEATTASTPPLASGQPADKPANGDTVPTSDREPSSSGDSGGRAESADHRATVLVVDDNAAIRHYITLSLAEHYRVLTASDGEEGLRLVRDEAPDIVISDIVMPRIDGIELCRRIKQEIATCHIPVILLTAKDLLMDRTEGYAAGADSYITKPFSSSLLESRIRNLLDMRRRLVEQLSSTSRKRQAQAMDTLGALDNEFLHRLNELIDRELVSEKLNVGFLSSELCMDTSTLYRKIKGLTGISTNEYIRKRRLRKAAELLRSGRYKVFEVAWMVGMNSENYFRQCFRDEFGISPSEYRGSEAVE